MITDINPRILEQALVIFRKDTIINGSVRSGIERRRIFDNVLEYKTPIVRVYGQIKNGVKEYRVIIAE